MSVILAIDTAAPRLQLALLGSDGQVDSLVEDMPNGQAERIFPAIAELLERNAATYADLTRIAVTTGPGSFTGLRIGLSAARGLGLALDIPVIGVPSLVAISLDVSTVDGAPFSVLVDARRNEAYLQSFSGPGIPDGDVVLKPRDGWLCGTQEIVTRSVASIEALARFAMDAEPAQYPPEAAYVRDADAKPQDKARIERVTP